MIGPVRTVAKDPEKLDRFRMDGELSHFDLRRMAQIFAAQRLPWDGVLSGAVEMTDMGDRSCDMGRKWVAEAGRAPDQPA